MASKARGLRSLVWEMKFPAALLTNPSSGPLAQMSLDHLLDRRRDPDIDGVGVDPPAGMLGHDLPGGLLQHAAAPAADHAVCAQFDEALHHDPAEARAAAGDQESLSLEQIGPEHRVTPLIALAVRLTCAQLIAHKSCCARLPDCYGFPHNNMGSLNDDPTGRDGRGRRSVELRGKVKWFNAVKGLWVLGPRQRQQRRVPACDDTSPVRA